MATPGELVQTIAQALGIPEATVVQYDRNLLAAGLRTKGGRGLSAAKVTSGDAANLLIAIAGGPIAGASVKETKATYDRFSTLRAVKKGKPTNFSRQLKARYHSVGKLSRGHTFAEAITAVIESDIAHEFRSAAPVYISLTSPEHRASVHLGEYMVAYYPRGEIRDQEEEQPDLAQTRSFGGYTISAIARLLRA